MTKLAVVLIEAWSRNFSNRTPSTCALADLGDGKRSRITQHLGVIKPTAAGRRHRTFAHRAPRHLYRDWSAVELSAPA